MEQLKELSVCFKVNNDMLSLKFQPTETELYNKLINDDTYSIQYVKLLIKNGMFVLSGSQNQKIQEIFRVLEDEEQLIFHMNIHGSNCNNQDQLSEYNKENEAQFLFESFESQEYDQNESQSQEYKKTEKNIDYWSDSATSFLLDKYETYMLNIGPMKKFKTKKLMWAQISKDMMTILNISKTPLQIENRYKTILKRKKKAVENNSKSGSSRETVPFEEELRKIAHADDSIEPEVLRSARSVKYPKLNAEMLEEISNGSASTHSTESLSPKTKKSKPSFVDKKIEYWEKKEAAKEKRHREKLDLIRELFAKQE
ncbi:PREDICTED: uncharacterized protein LOC108781859 [Cyphomyrmex costatus]|uniref:uncharacterized protein LOC108781859 n=1 Tax=Cyphomyrmex costatus TaxID=456900 RepID=UPI0008522730|nr:PREDICTED: uncharacterized protein LOC108781859 [Cyphomyrmex costatus]